MQAKQQIARLRSC